MWGENAGWPLVPMTGPARFALVIQMACTHAAAMAVLASLARTHGVARNVAAAASARAGCYGPTQSKSRPYAAYGTADRSSCAGRACSCQRGRAGRHRPRCCPTGLAERDEGCYLRRTTSRKLSTPASCASSLMFVRSSWRHAFVSSLSPATRSCGSVALLNLYWHLPPVSGRRLTTS